MAEPLHQAGDIAVVGGVYAYDPTNPMTSGFFTAIHADPEAAIDHATTNDVAIKLFNAERAKYNLPPYKSHPALVVAAQGHSDWMAENQVMDHYGPGRDNWADRVRAAGYPGADLTNVGENVAAWQISIAQTVGDWMKSSGHRAAILHARHQHAGIASATDANGRNYWCADFCSGAPDPSPPEPVRDEHYFFYGHPDE